MKIYSLNTIYLTLLSTFPFVQNCKIHYPMVQSLALSSPTSFRSSFQNHSSSAAAVFRSPRRVLFVRKSNRRALIYAAAISEAPASLYDVLRVKQNASAKEIKGAYRNLAKLYHPDAVTPPEESSDGRDFIFIHDAYVTLSDPAARELYDLKLSVASRRRGFGRSSDVFRMNGSTRKWETDQCW